MAGDCGSSCPADGGFYSYDPNVGGNAVLLAAYAILVPVVFYTGIRFQTPAFSAVLTTALVVEALGFAGRLLLRGARDNQGYFAMSLIGTALGPSLVTGAIFLILPHILSIYGERVSPCKPTLAGILACSMAGLAAVVQIVGIVSTTYGLNGMSTHGAGIMAAGFALQSLALLGVTGLYFWFTLGLSDGQHFPDPKHSPVYRSAQFGRFLRGMEVSNTLLLVYSVYRVIELATGAAGGAFQNEAAFMIIDGTIPLFVCILATALHPGAAFGQAWDPTSVRRFQRRAPPPLHPGIRHATHHRYDPNIRRQFTPTSQSQRSPPYSAPPTLPSWSPGLPSSPRPSHKLPSPIVSSPNSTIATSHYSKRFSDRSERNSQVPRGLVDSDALW